MPIEIAEDNHIAELTKLSKTDVKNGLRYGNLVTIAEFKEQVESGLVTSDETALMCGFSGSDWYVGDYCIDVDTILPNWVTHIYWYGK